MGTGTGDGPGCRGRCVVLQGFQPPTDDRAWCERSRRWTAGAPRDLPATAVTGRIENGTVVTVVPDREPPYRIVAIDADDGRIEWENTISHGVRRLRVEDGVAYASVADDEGRRLTILDGSSVRQRVSFGPTDLLAAVRDGVAYLRDFRAESAAPSIKAIDAESGETRQLLDRPTVSEQISGTPTGVGDIVVGPDRLFAAVTTETGSDPAVLALNRSDGAIEWARQFSGRLQLTGTSDALYVAGPREPGPHAYALEPGPAIACGRSSCPIVLVIAVASIQRGNDASLWSMPLSQFERAAIFAGTVVLALLVLAFGSWSTLRLDQISWVGIAGAIGIVVTVLIAGRLFVAPVTIVRDGRGSIEVIRWSNESIANSGMTTRTVLIVFWVSVLVRWAATLAIFPSAPVVGLALATVVGTTVVSAFHAMAMALIYRDVQRESTTGPSITNLG